MNFLSFFSEGLSDKTILNILLMLHAYSITVTELLKNYGISIHMIDRQNPPKTESVC